MRSIGREMLYHGVESLAGFLETGCEHAQRMVRDDSEHDDTELLVTCFVLGKIIGRWVDERGSASDHIACIGIWKDAEHDQSGGDEFIREEKEGRQDKNNVAVR